MRVSAAIFASFVIPILALLLAWLPSPFKRPRAPRRTGKNSIDAAAPDGVAKGESVQRRNWPRARVTSVACLGLYLLLSAFVTRTLMQDARASEKALQFTAELDQLEGMRDHMDGNWAGMLPGIESVSKVKKFDEATDADLQAEATQMRQLLTFYMSVFLSHELIVTAVGGSMTPSDLTATSARVSEIQNSLQTAQDGRQAQAMRGLLVAAWTELPGLVTRARSSLIGGMDAVIQSQRAKYRDEPEHWLPVLDDEKIKRIRGDTQAPASALDVGTAPR